MTAEVSCEVVAPRSTSVAVVGPMPGRQRAKGFLSKLHDLQEVAIRVPSENHAVVERHRYEIQKHSHTHMNVGFGGAIVRLTGTASAIRHTRRSVATLLMRHWREQQRQRREVALEQVVANAMEVRIVLSLTTSMVELLNRKEPTEPNNQRRHDEAEAERRLEEQRLISLTQELSREYVAYAAHCTGNMLKQLCCDWVFLDYKEQDIMTFYLLFWVCLLLPTCLQYYHHIPLPCHRYERLSSSLRGQLSLVGMTNVALCNDDFTRGDRVCLD